jgi:hypothetical protein
MYTAPSVQFKPHTHAINFEQSWQSGVDLDSYLAFALSPLHRMYTCTHCKHGKSEASGIQTAETLQQW